MSSQEILKRMIGTLLLRVDKLEKQVERLCNDDAEMRKAFREELDDVWQAIERTTVRGGLLKR